MRVERRSARGTSSASNTSLTSDARLTSFTSSASYSRFTSFASFTRFTRYSSFASSASPAGFAQPIINYSIPPTFVFETSASRFTLAPSFT